MTLAVGTSKGKISERNLCYEISNKTYIDTVGDFTEIHVESVETGMYRLEVTTVRHHCPHDFGSNLPWHRPMADAIKEDVQPDSEARVRPDPEHVFRLSHLQQ